MVVGKKKSLRYTECGAIRVAMADFNQGRRQLSLGGQFGIAQCFVLSLRHGGKDAKDRNKPKRISLHSSLLLGSSGHANPHRVHFDRIIEKIRAKWRKIGRAA